MPNTTRTSSGRPAGRSIGRVDPRAFIEAVVSLTPCQLGQHDWIVAPEGYLAGLIDRCTICGEERA